MGERPETFPSLAQTDFHLPASPSAGRARPPAHRHAPPRRGSRGVDLLSLLAPPLCLCCRTPLERAARGPGLCARCSAEIEREPGIAFAADGIDSGYAPLAYDGPGRRLVAALKFSRLLVVAELGAALIAAGAPDGGRAAAVIVPVPGAPIRSLRRGFDPAWEIAAALAGLTGMGARAGAAAPRSAAPARPPAARPARRAAEDRGDGRRPADRPARRRRRDHRGDDDGVRAGAASGRFGTGPRGRDRSRPPTGETRLTPGT